MLSSFEFKFNRLVEMRREREGGRSTFMVRMPMEYEAMRRCISKKLENAKKILGKISVRQRKGEKKRAGGGGPEDIECQLRALLELLLQDSCQGPHDSVVLDQDF
jgi:hypothetical protein